MSDKGAEDSVSSSDELNDEQEMGMQRLGIPARDRPQTLPHTESSELSTEKAVLVKRRVKKIPPIQVFVSIHIQIGIHF
jgi:hypothetical protein